MFLLPPMLRGCDLHIATPHCVHSVGSITNHNRLDNFQSQEIVKASSEIVQYYYNTSSSISSPLEPWAGGPLLGAPYSISTLCIALIPFFLVFLRVCDCTTILKGVFQNLLLLQRPRSPQTPCRTFWHWKQTISPYTTTIVDTLFQISIILSH